MCALAGGKGRRGGRAKHSETGESFSSLHDVMFPDSTKSGREKRRGGKNLLYGGTGEKFSRRSAEGGERKGLSGVIRGKGVESHRSAEGGAPTNNLIS